MRQRLGIATALLGDPDMLIFDEPVNGLDTSTGIAALVAVAFATTPAGQLLAAFDALSSALLSQEYAVIAAGALGVC